MADAFLGLSPTDRLDALLVAADRSGRPAHVLEKDVWVVWAINALFSGPGGDHLVFKGGTSLSKAYGIIDRFSEDIDLTYDIRELVPASREAPTEGDEPHPRSRNQAKDWRAQAEAALDEWINADVRPALTESLEREKLDSRIVVEPQKLILTTTPRTDGWDYVKPDVLIEFGGRSTGLPVEVRPLVCDAAQHLPELSFPTAQPRVMAAERTFWEKATAVHAFNAQEALKGDRLSRHWYDLSRLDETGYADRAIADRDLALQVAAHKTQFFPVSGTDYAEAISGGLRLIPSPDFVKAVQADYQAMLDGGLLQNGTLSFDALMERCSDLEKRVNSAS
jgi:hypothetical protein